MARTSKRTDIKIPKQKPMKGFGWEATKLVDEFFVPKTPVDVAFTLMGGSVIRAGVKGAKKVIKTATKSKKVTKTTKKK